MDLGLWGVRVGGGVGIGGWGWVEVRVAPLDLELQPDELVSQKRDRVARRERGEQLRRARGGREGHEWRRPARAARALSVLVGGGGGGGDEDARKVEAVLGERARLVEGRELDLAADGDPLGVDAEDAAG